MKRRQQLYEILKNIVKSLNQFPIDLLKLICEFEKEYSHIYIQTKCGNYIKPELMFYKLNIDENIYNNNDKNKINWQQIKNSTKLYPYFSIRNHDIISNDNDTMFCIHVTSVPNKKTKMEISIYRSENSSEKVINIKRECDDIFHHSSYTLDANLNLYMIGGIQDRISTNKVSILRNNNNNYDIMVNLPVMICKRQGPSSIIINQILYVIGKDITNKQVECLDLNLNLNLPQNQKSSWRLLAPMLDRRLGLMKVLHIRNTHHLGDLNGDDRILLIGGEINYQNLFPEFYDIKTNTWHSLNWEIPFKCHIFTANIVANNLILINMDSLENPKYQVYIRPLTFQNMLENIPFKKLPAFPDIGQDFIWSCSIDQSIFF